MSKIEEAYQGYKKSCFRDIVMSEVQDKELRSAFFGGVTWLKAKLSSGLGDNEEKTLEFLTGVQEELEEFIRGILVGVN